MRILENLTCRNTTSNKFQAATFIQCFTVAPPWHHNHMSHEGRTTANMHDHREETMNTNVSCLDTKRMLARHHDVRAALQILGLMHLNPLKPLYLTPASSPRSNHQSQTEQDSKRECWASALSVLFNPISLFLYSLRLNNVCVFTLSAPRRRRRRRIGVFKY